MGPALLIIRMSVKGADLSSSRVLDNMMRISGFRFAPTLTPTPCLSLTPTSTPTSTPTPILTPTLCHGCRSEDGWEKKLWRRTLTLKVKNVPITHEYVRPYLVHTHAPGTSSPCKPRHGWTLRGSVCGSMCSSGHTLPRPRSDACLCGTIAGLTMYLQYRKSSGSGAFTQRICALR